MACIPPRYWKTNWRWYCGNSMEEFDYIIVGAGSAGSVLANRLTEDADVRVCVLEAGPADRNPFIHIPAGFMKTFTNPDVNWLYDTEPSEWTGGRRIQVPRGKTLGGSSSINGHIYTRGQRLDFDGWAQQGNRGWGYADVLPYFKRSEGRIGDGDDKFRGRDGPLTVTDIDWIHPLCEAFIEGAVSFGIPRNPDYNGTSQEGVAYTQRNIHKGRRVSAARAFLHPAMKRANLRVQTNAHATSVIFDGNRAAGIRYNVGGRNGSSREVRAAREVLLCGGVINSPQLLQLSGVGPRKLLANSGLPLTHVLQGVGENLCDHYAPRFSARVKNSSSINELTRGLPLLGQIAKWMTTRKGVLSLSPSLVYCFWHSDEAIRNGDLQLTFTPANYKEGVQSALDDQPGMTVASWQQRPESRGYVRIRNADPFDKPIIQPNYLDRETDRRVLLAGMKLARQLLQTDPLKPYFESEIFPGPDVRTDGELLDAARQRATTTFHPMGTCKMGPESDPDAVVDDELRIHGLTGIRVVDASVMPTMPSANLNAATIMIAEKAADMRRGRAPLPAVDLAD